MATDRPMDSYIVGVYCHCYRLHTGTDV